MLKARILILVLWAASAWAQRGLPADFDAYVRRAMSEFDVPGLSVAVVKDQAVVLTKGYGLRSAGKPGAVDADTVFGIASLSKAFTAAALAMLVDEGKLSWDDPVVKHLPWFQLWDPWVTREITVRDLLCHRSGLPAYGGDMLSFFSPLPREEIVRRLRWLKPESSFRSRYAYQNNMYLTAGELLRAVSGKSWDQLVAERIFQPLGMKRSSTSIRQFPADGNVAMPHAKIGAGQRLIEWPNWDSTGAAGAINSTARDMAAWALLQLGGGEYGGRRLFSAASSRQMWTPHTITPAPRPPEGSKLPRPNFTAYGLGWALFDYHGRKVATHSGGLTGMTCRLLLVPDERLGVLVLTNAENPVHYALIYRVVDAYLGLPETDWIAEYRSAQRKAPQKRFPARVEGTRPSLPPEAYAGRYHNPMLGEVEIERLPQGWRFRLKELGPEAEASMEHWNYETFRLRWKDPTWPQTNLVFRLNSKGGVEGARMEVAEPADPSFDFQNYPLERVHAKP